MASHKGKYTVKNPEKYIGNPNLVTYRSSWELRFMMKCDSDPRIVKWKSEGHPIKYLNDVDGKIHRYFIDFFVQVIDKEGKIKNIAIEIKPHAQTLRPSQDKLTRNRFLKEMKTYITNQSKWRAARKWAIQNNFDFVILTEKELGL